MSFFADAQETADRYGKYITEYQELFRTNEVSFGSPEDFFRLAPKLAYDDRFHVEFSALTRSVGQREEGRLTLTRILTLIAIAMGGMGIEQVGSASAVPISLVVVFLAGIGGWSETEAALVEVAEAGARAREKMHSGGADIAGGAGTVEADEEREARELEHRLAAGPGDDLETLTTSLFGGPAQVKEALSRLEMNTLQLKLHLDNIDSRMQRIEPHLDDLTWRFAVQPEPAQRTEPNAEEQPHLPEQRYSETGPEMKPWPTREEQASTWEPGPAREAVPTREPMPAPAMKRWAAREEERPAWEPETAREAVPTPEPMPMQEAAPLRAGRLEPELDLSIRVPFDEYLRREPEGGSERRWVRRMVPALGVLLVVLAVAGGALLYRNHGWRNFNVGWQWEKEAAGVVAAKGRAAVAKGKEIWAEFPLTGSAATSEDATKGAEGVDSGSSQVQPASTPTASVPVPARARAPVLAGRNGSGYAGGPRDALDDVTGKARTAEKESRPVVAAVGGLGTVGEASGGVPPGTGTTVAAAQSPESSTPVFVEASHLFVLSETQPIYPRDALAEGITGEVVVQAIISRSGTVESAQIVSGPPGLLKASVEAMKDWRYRPYLVKGEPVEVRTFVKFQFSADHANR